VLRLLLLEPSLLLKAAQGSKNSSVGWLSQCNVTACFTAAATTPLGVALNVIV
jgi:hypothetical protein